MQQTADYTGESLSRAIDQVTVELDTAELFFGHGSLDAGEEATWLIMSACGLPLDTEPDWDMIINGAQSRNIRTLCDQRIETRKPLAYLTGEAWFAGMPFNVDERVLVPRSFMAEWIADGFAPWIQPQRVKRVLDLCCGSGCIGIAAASVFVDATVVLSDISSDALDVAKSNVERHRLTNRVSVVQSDGLDSVAGTYDLILCNPPYVAEKVMQTLPDEYRHEPSLGLVAGEAGLDFIDPLLLAAPDWLADGGALIVEAGSAGPAVQSAWPGTPFTWLGTEFDEMVLFMVDRDQLTDHRKYLEQR